MRKAATHDPKNKRVKVSGVTHEVASARWCYGLVAYMLKGSGRMVYSWESHVEAL